MPKKAVLIITEELMKKIDENRGELSRAEFIDVCIDSLLGEGEVKEEEKHPPKKEGVERPKPPEAEEKEVYVSREEFEEFKQSIKDVQKTFIDFFLTYGLELGGQPTTAEQERFRQMVKRLLEL
jgi:hypothetical protein